MLALDTPLSARKVADMLGAECIGAEDVLLTHITSLHESHEQSLSFSQDGRIERPIGCLLASTAHPLARSTILTDQPKLALRALLMQLNILDRFKSSFQGIHPTAIIHASASVAANVSIGPYAVIEADCTIEEGVTIAPHAHIMQHVSIEQASHIGSGAVIFPHVCIGKRVYIGSRSVLGDAGFGFDWDQAWTMFPQVARVRIEDDVYIGSSSVIDRGALSDTRIQAGSKLGAMMMIAHGVTLGKHVMLAGCGAVGGSSHIGDYTLAGGCVAIADHVHIPAHTQLAGNASVGTSLRTGGPYASALPVLPSRQWRRLLRFILRTVADPATH